MNDSGNILVTTLGTSWQIIPELLAFTNPGQILLLQHSPFIDEIERSRIDHEIVPVQEIWMVTTQQPGDLPDSDNMNSLQSWSQLLNACGVTSRLFIAEGVNDLMTSGECVAMTDLIYRVVMQAREKSHQHKLYLSLAGGRKTMSADMQQAAYIFGCDGLIHITTKSPLPSWSRIDDPQFWMQALTREQANDIRPVMIAGRIERSPVLDVQDKIAPENYPLNTDHAINFIRSDGQLLKKVKEKLSNAGQLLSIFHKELIHRQPQQNFLELYALPPHRIEALRNTSIGVDIDRKKMELEWLNNLPKADLHCHLGGILDPGDMIRVARRLSAKVDEARKNSGDFDKWLNHVQNLIHNQNLTDLCLDVPDVKAIRNKYNIPEPIGVCGFLLQFDGHEQLLELFIYHDFESHRKFIHIGIDVYEKLGDLQGSGLLKHPDTLRETLQILKEKCIKHNVWHQELRCSPMNYVTPDFSADNILSLLIQELSDFQDCQFKLIFIASRHGKMSRIYEHIELYDAWKNKEQFRVLFGGFDLAGNEGIRSPANLREAFLPLLADCINITIHAGEDQPVENIWEAVYHLNADRIGHGLSLSDNTDLLRRFIDKQIAVEMCPSSNLQIVGYDHYISRISGYKKYPLKDFLDDGLCVTINTDDPGISQTNITEEYYQAAAMTRGGLTKWDLIQIVKNGFTASFTHFNERKELLMKAGNRIIQIINQ